MAVPPRRILNASDRQQHNTLLHCRGRFADQSARQGIVRGAWFSEPSLD